MAIEYRIWRRIRLGRDELARMTSAPFPIEPDSLFVCYSAPAEVGCFVELGWPMPRSILDLYVMFRLIMNVGSGKGQRSMIAALSKYRLEHIAADEKAGIRELAMRGAPWSAQEMADLLGHCESDVLGLLALLPRMIPDLLRLGVTADEAPFLGRYSGPAVTRIGPVGIPIDAGPAARC